MQHANNVNRVRSQVLEIDSYRRSPIASKPTEARIIPREVFRSNFWILKGRFISAYKEKKTVIFIRAIMEITANMLFSAIAVSIAISNLPKPKPIMGPTIKIKRTSDGFIEASK